LCSQAEESIDHLAISCVFSRVVWLGVLRAAGCHHLTPTGALAIVDWWLPTRKRVHKSNRKGFDTLFALVVWSLWLEQNARGVFNAKTSTARQLCAAIRHEGRQWELAGYRDLEEFMARCRLCSCFVAACNLVAVVFRLVAVLLPGLL
jgi:hypothetical protein